MRVKFKCARCKQAVYEGQPDGISSLYRSRHLLCESCFFDEDNEIDAKGTNDLSDTLATYGRENDYSED